jgi:hypothetical protein
MRTAKAVWKNVRTIPEILKPAIAGAQEFATKKSAPRA